MSKTRSDIRRPDRGHTEGSGDGSPPQPGQRHRWLVLGIVLVGSFMAVLDGICRS
jgi:hypothetical protein